MSVQAIVNGTVVAKSNATEVVEGNYYFPRASVDEKYLKPSETTYTCSWKGECTYYNIDIEGNVLEDGAWSYQAPKDAAAHIAGFIAFAPQVTIKT